MRAPFYRLFNALRPLRPLSALAGIVLLANTQGVLGADASNGKTLYNYKVGGIACSNVICHGPNPSANLNLTRAGGNNPTKIGNAITNNAGGTMGAAVKFTAAQLADIAAYIAKPDAGPPTAPVVSVAPAALTFPSTTVGQSSSAQSAVVSNTGTAALVVASLRLSGVSSSDYSIAGGSCISGGTVAAGASCTVAVTFKPGAAGTRSASVDIVHNAVAAVSTISLAGAGAASTDTAANLVVEYYHSGLDHYFVSANPPEIAGLDANPALGWQRTGHSFKSGGSTPVCRFYGSVSPGPNTRGSVGMIISGLRTGQVFSTLP